MKKEKSRKELIFGTLSFMWQITEPIHKHYRVFCIIVLVSQMASMMLSIVIGKGVDVIMGTNKSLTIAVILGMILGISILRNVLSMIETTYHISYIAYDIGGIIERYSLRKLFRFSPGQTTRENTGLKMDVLQKGDAAFAELMALVFTNILPICIKLVIAIAIITSINWILGLIILVSITCFAFVSYKVNNYFSDSMRRVKKMETNMNTKYWEVIKHLKLVIMMAMQDKTLSIYSQVQEEVYAAGRKVWISYNTAVGFLRNTLFEHMVYAPLFFLIFYLVQKKAISFGDVTVVISLIGLVYSSINQIGTIQRQLVRHSVSVLQFKQLIEQEPECIDVEEAIELANPRGNVEFKDVTFTYKEGELPALRGISFSIKQGETIAFVGHSGSGKSTIISLLLRAQIPQSGEIIIDGLPLNGIAINSLRRRIGIVSQQTFLWDDSVRFNVLYGVDREIDDPALDQILESAQIVKFYPRLGSAGIDTVIGENGVQLSGGECQRIAIARALARDPKLIIFDEATSALDYETEADVYAAMNEALRDRTGIIIAHRLGTVKKANRIIVLHEGQIVGEGSFDELSEKNEHFKRLIGSQLK